MSFETHAEGNRLDENDIVEDGQSTRADFVLGLEDAQRNVDAQSDKQEKRLKGPGYGIALDIVVLSLEAFGSAMRSDALLFKSIWVLAEV
jgi:hypothetical protein